MVSLEKVIRRPKREDMLFMTVNWEKQNLRNKEESSRPGMIPGLEEIGRASGLQWRERLAKTQACSSLSLGVASPTPGHLGALWSPS